MIILYCDDLTLYHNAKFMFALRSHGMIMIGYTSIGSYSSPADSCMRQLNKRTETPACWSATISAINIIPQFGMTDCIKYGTFL